VFISGNEIRKSISKKVKNTAEFRAGVIWGAYNRYPTTFPTVDVAIFDNSFNRLLLGRKPKEEKYRFVGGFAEPHSESYEMDAVREVHEEAGDIEITPPVYIGSFKVDDWRYRNEVDKIKTLFFVTKVVFGTPKAGDDIVEVRWFEFDKFNPDNLVDNHKKLWDALVLFMKDKKMFVEKLQKG
jgi:bifunctional NMN adenylyltransferase/nudix hydrolase